MGEAKFGLRLAECLSARLCHELVGPIGAIANGVELLGEDAGFAEEATGLIQNSSGEAVARLQFYRFAYGASVEIKATDARKALMAAFAEGRVACEWPEEWTPPSWRWIKLALNLFVAGAECLPRGGTLRLSTADGLSLACEGEGARVPEIFVSSFQPSLPLEALTPRTVQAVFTYRIARDVGLSLGVDSVRPGRVSLHATRL